ncbi:hypothetical protein SFRURICE_012432 [Spodoptera frugiperda]|uniref:SFRICE_005809 n=1 Tax=Spodoptera frugiperda TaxID=7108 RepID=A0A2H1VWG9_SPOFR|nr:hypothetical protein SFRURICE_012432 [Spodoptera frugiperda]
MTSKHLFLLLLALFASTIAQSDDELHIPVENDNQFPPDNPEGDGSVVEGSGAGVIEEPLEASTEKSALLLDDVQLTSLTNNVPVVEAEEHACPKPCVCNIEGDTNKYIVDCSGYELTELPKPLDPKTTDLNLQNNKITEIPKDISELKNLKVLNVNNNEIMKIVSGSISELPELTSLKLGNNRLLEYPQDLKNGFGLTKLEELDLGGNDMRTGIKPESFTNFKALRSLTLPTTAANLAEDLCAAMKESLVSVCTGTCNEKTLECPDAPPASDLEEGLLDFALPGLIALGATPDEETDDPAVNSPPEEHKETDSNVPAAPKANVETTSQAPISNAPEATNSVADFSLRSAIIKTSEKQPEAESSSTAPAKPESEVVGATTSDKKSGGVDKSVIGMIVAGMVLVVAGITIKKNWSSIRNRFSSSPARNANDRANVNANGTAPEEVPLQEKSPV